MAFEIPGFSITLPANETFVSKQFRFGTLTSGGKVAVSADGAWVVGVVQNTPTTDRAATVMVDGISIVEAGAAVAVGDAISSDSVGRAKTSATADIIVGRALEAATAAGQYIAVLLGGRPDASA